MRQIWEERGRQGPLPKAELLRLWDRDTAEIDEIWPAILSDRFQERMTAFGQWTARGIELFGRIAQDKGSSVIVVIHHHRALDGFDRLLRLARFG